VIDDNESIQADFRKVLLPDERVSALAAAKAALFGSTPRTPVSGRDGAPAAEASRTAAVPRRFEVDCCSDGQRGVQQAKEACESGAPYLVAFVDMRMPGGWDGLTTIRHLWRADPRIEVVICTAYSDHSHEQIMEDLGPSDRLLLLKKPFDNIEVVQLAVTLSEKWLAARAAGLKREELEHLVQERTTEIEHAMLHDRLTGLPNRTLMQARLENCIQRRQRHPNERFAILFLDFDQFKLINDSFGHEVGDVLLIEMANRLRDALRGSDAVCRGGLASRMGGDEFVVLIEDLREERDAARVVERLLAALAGPYTVEGQALCISASVGIATSDRNYERAADMIRDADTAMYRAKAAGRNRYVMFDRQMHREVMTRLCLEAALRRDVQDRPLALHYQPVVRVADGRISGFEALLRWTHPEHGLVPATEVINIAEDTGLIHPLSLNVLRAACEQLRAWQDRPTDPSGQGVTQRSLQPLMVSVNLSRRLFIDPELVENIRKVIQDAGIPPNTLILEITESAAMDNRARAAAMLEELKDLGIWLHLDDFGTGYSSLSCLFELPLSGLKIDRAFTERVAQRSEYAVVLEAIVRIARAFHLQVVAEGIETTEEFQLVRDLGIDFAQGYLLGRPLPAEEAFAFLGEPVGMA